MGRGGVPLVLHLGAVVAEPFECGGADVFVCENPAVVEEAAIALGPAAPALVCVEGQLSVAAVRLLGMLAAGGARLRYHGDFGAGGLTIANRVVGELGATPWRMATADYQVALAACRDRG
ncbi:MAG: DUF2399 domain-containing protein [Acidimicrobiia bacterium]|nr:DUF2399 domain-containing protein [Acidimicrobiia bacterium]